MSDCGMRTPPAAPDTESRDGREWMGPGGPLGLQILWTGANHIRGGFDSHTFPPVNVPRWGAAVVLLAALMLAHPALAATAPGDDAAPPPAKGASPRGALFRLTLVPGWGQVATGHPLKGAVFASGAAALGAGIAVQSHRANLATSSANDAVERGDEDAYSRFVAERESHLTSRGTISYHGSFCCGCTTWWMPTWKDTSSDSRDSGWSPSRPLRARTTAPPGGADSHRQHPVPWIARRDERDQPPASDRFSMPGDRAGGRKRVRRKSVFRDTRRSASRRSCWPLPTAPSWCRPSASRRAPWRTPAGGGLPAGEQVPLRRAYPAHPLATARAPSAAPRGAEHDDVPAVRLTGARAVASGGAGCHARRRRNLFTRGSPPPAGCPPWSPMGCGRPAPLRVGGTARPARAPRRPISAYSRSHTELPVRRARAARPVPGHWKLIAGRAGRSRSIPPRYPWNRMLTMGIRRPPGAAVVRARRRREGLQHPDPSNPTRWSFHLGIHHVAHRQRMSHDTRLSRAGEMGFSLGHGNGCRRPRPPLHRVVRRGRGQVGAGDWTAIPAPRAAAPEAKTAPFSG